MSGSDGHKLPPTGPSGLGLGLAAAKQHGGGSSSGSRGIGTRPQQVHNRLPGHHDFAGGRQQPHGAGPAMAQSAPVYDPLFQAPRAPLPKPRASMAEPPPMSLPPSPPVHAPHLPADTGSSSQSIDRNADGSKPSSRQQAIAYSRSLSNNPSIDFLLGSSMGHRSNTNSTSIDTVAEDDDLDDPQTLGRLGRNVSSTNDNEQLIRPNISELGKSPTVFSLLSGKPAMSHTMPQRSHVPQSLPNFNPHQPLQPSSRATTPHQQQTADTQSAASDIPRARERKPKQTDDELQFDINLEGESDEDDTAGTQQHTAY